MGIFEYCKNRMQQCILSHHFRAVIYPKKGVKRSKAFLHTPDSYKPLTAGSICWNKVLLKHICIPLPTYFLYKIGLTSQPHLEWKRIWKSMNTKGLHWLFQRVGNNLVLFWMLHRFVSEYFFFFLCIQLCLLCDMVRWRCLRRSQLVWELYQRTREPLKGKTWRVREAPESSYGGYVQQQEWEDEASVSWRFIAYTVISKRYSFQDPKQYLYFVQKQRYIANTNQMPEVFEWCHICKLPSIGIFTTLHRPNLITPFWLMGFPVYK